ncbi:UNVERIFIED_CONTAM: hypothetical protein FKN15_072535 [Acipenser sinensis]
MRATDTTLWLVVVVSFREQGLRASDYYDYGHGINEDSYDSYGSPRRPADVQAVLEQLMVSVPSQECLVYLGDLLVYGASFQAALDALQRVLQRVTTVAGGPVVAPLGRSDTAVPSNEGPVVAVGWNGHAGVLQRQWKEPATGEVRWQVVVPQAMQEDVLKAHHGTPGTRHFEVIKTCDRGTTGEVQSTDGTLREYVRGAQYPEVPDFKP